MNRMLFLSAVLAAIGPLCAAAADPLTIGKPAPKLKVDTWVKGDPIGGINNGKIYVIEFWGTSCGPCIRCMPHLSDLQRQHKDVLFACLSDEPEKTIRDFVSKHGKKMGFRVGVDEKGRMWNAWMKAAGLEGIPTAFIVDAKGNVAWIGDPTEIDEPLQRILDGNYDPRPAIIRLRLVKARKAAFRKENERLKRGNRLAVRVEKLILTKKAAEAVALMEQAIDKEPSERVWYGQMKLQALVAEPKLRKKTLEYGIELAAEASVRANHEQSTTQVLLHIASLLTNSLGDVVPPDPECCDLAITIVKLAEEIARQEKDSVGRDQVDQSIRIESTLAYAYAGKGQLDKAVAHGDSALRHCRTAIPPPDADEKQFRQDMENWGQMLEADLARFKKSKVPVQK